MTDEKESGEKGLYVSPIATNLFKAVGIEEEEERSSSSLNLTPKLAGATIPTTAGINTPGLESKKRSNSHSMTSETKTPEPHSQSPLTITNQRLVKLPR